MEPTSVDRVQQRPSIIVSEKTAILPRMKEVCLFVHRQLNPKRDRMLSDFRLDCIH